MVKVETSPLQIVVFGVERPIAVGVGTLEVGARVGALDGVETYWQKEVGAPDTYVCGEKGRGDLLAERGWCSRYLCLWRVPIGV